METLSGSLSATLLEPQIRNPFTNPKHWQPNWAGRLLWTTFGTGREFFQNRDCCEAHSELNGSFSKTFCWELYQEPYRLFGNHIAKPIGNLSTTPSAPKPCIGTLLGTLNLEPYTGTLSETLSGTLKPLFGTLLGTWNLRPEIGNWLGTLLGTGRNPAESCPNMPETFTNGWRPQALSRWGKMCWELCWKISWGETLLGTPVETVENPVGTLLETLLGTLFGNPVWEPCLGTLFGNPAWEPCLGTLV